MNWMEEAKKRQDELLAELQQLIQIPSVLDETQSTAEHPFGPEPLKALEWLLQKGKEAGMEVKNVDQMAGHIEMGEGEELLGILGHVDVVPAGKGWTYPPFEGHIENDRLYGRGAIDDKGPTMAAWMAMKMVKDAGVPLNKRVRLIIGTDEESGFRCVERYFEKEEMPHIGFAPDADFPIINAEKGISTLRFTTANLEQEEQLESFQAGTRTNMVPDLATAVLLADRDTIEHEFKQFAQQHQLQGSVQIKDQAIHLTLEGKSAHAMEPNDGINAGVYLAEFLKDIVITSGSKTFVEFVATSFMNDSRGHAFGLNYNDEMSGDTTLNAGILSFNPAKGGTVDVSLRYSVSYDFEKQLTQCQAMLSEKAIAVDLTSNSEPHYIEESDELIQSLSRVYERQTGEKATLLSIGGGTYARVLKKGVAFGMLFPGEKDVAHQVDEFVDIPNLIKAVAIYADAICELASNQS
ncbi:dipeptidase PepV [Paenisporosarcina quisquiliarum]|uniref:Dipeptidase PepV n=1 Tax=Paenisporosarcina quisquiliarum TaxID=365346 RepID=A0A9X3RCM4_9BACL|nr:dipeptidase PepV [Paenisporosarcina quisquiliarum]